MSKAGLAILLALFLLSAAVGVWVAFDRPAAWGRFGLLALSALLALGVTWAGQAGGEDALGVSSLGCALLAAAIGVYFLLTLDQASVVDSSLAVTLPLGGGGLAWAWTRRRRLAVVLGGSALLLALAALLLTAARDAWLGLGAGALAAAYLAWRTRPSSPRWLHRLGDGLMAGIVLAALGFFGVALLWPGGDQFLSVAPAAESLSDRAALWRDGLTLVRDYPFTGSGLGGAALVYASYVRLLHVVYVPHMHNLFLQVAVEQGLPGLAVFGALLGVAGWRLAQAWRTGGSELAFRLSATTALVALVVHGAVDAGAYAGWAVVVVLLPVGFAVAVGGGIKRVTPMASLAVTVLVALALLLPGSRATLQANLGAVAQTQAELAVYRWPQWPVQDAVRRSPEVNLAPALARYRAALVQRPTQATANRRLGQIELSLGRYAEAQGHLAAAYAAAPDEQVVRRLLAESYAVAGAVEQATALWRTVDSGQGQLALRQWWYDHIGESQRAAWIGEAKQQASRK